MNYVKIDIKPLSVNEAWKGRRFKTDKHKEWRNALKFLLPNIKTDFKGRLRIYFEFGFSSILSDVDNPVKPLLDTLQDKYRFNDRDVYEINIKKALVDKGNEYIKFKIEQLWKFILEFI